MRGFFFLFGRKKVYDEASMVHQTHYGARDMFKEHSDAERSNSKRTGLVQNSSSVGRKSVDAAPRAHRVVALAKMEQHGRLRADVVRRCEGHWTAETAKFLGEGAFSKLFVSKCTLTDGPKPKTYYSATKRVRLTKENVLGAIKDKVVWELMMAGKKRQFIGKDGVKKEVTNPEISELNQALWLPDWSKYKKGEEITVHLDMTGPDLLEYFATMDFQASAGTAVYTNVLDQVRGILPKIALDVTVGLNYMHKTFQCAHLDLKPENIGTRDFREIPSTDFNIPGRFQILDFGLSESVYFKDNKAGCQRWEEETGSDDVKKMKLYQSDGSQCSDMVGSPSFVAPEILDGRRIKRVWNERKKRYEKGEIHTYNGFRADMFELYRTVLKCSLMCFLKTCPQDLQQTAGDRIRDFDKYATQVFSGMQENRRNLEPTHKIGVPVPVPLVTWTSTHRCEFGSVDVVHGLKNTMIQYRCYPSEIESIVNTCSFWDPSRRATAQELIDSWRSKNMSSSGANTCEKQSDVGRRCVIGSSKFPYECAPSQKGALVRGMWHGICRVDEAASAAATKVQGFYRSKMPRAPAAATGASKATDSGRTSPVSGTASPPRPPSSSVTVS